MNVTRQPGMQGCANGGDAYEFRGEIGRAICHRELFLKFVPFKADSYRDVVGQANCATMEVIEGRGWRGLAFSFMTVSG